ncbi:MAG: proteasome subunit alpha [Antricoccus sp.]
MTMPMYVSAEQLMRDKTEFARKGIARGRTVIVMSYQDGVLMIAENASSTLHKVGEIYDRIGFAAVGRYNEFENLRQAGIRYADQRGFSYDRRDVTGRGLANAFAQTLGTIFSEQMKPFEVEICVAEVGTEPGKDELYRLTFDGSVVDEPNFVVMGGQSELVSTHLKESYQEVATLDTAVQLCIGALDAVEGNGNGRDRATNLEVAILRRGVTGRSFRRLVGAQLSELIGAATSAIADLRDGDHADDESMPSDTSSQSDIEE